MAPVEGFGVLFCEAVFGELPFFGGRREVEETCWRGRLVGPPPPRGTSAEVVEGDERLAGRVAYLEWNLVLVTGLLCLVKGNNEGGGMSDEDGTGFVRCFTIHLLL